jgi:hypothetical protein
MTAIAPETQAQANGQPPTAPASTAITRPLSEAAEAWQLKTRAASAFSKSSLLPTSYQGEAGIPNVLIAMEIAERIGCSIFMVAQNLDIIHNRPSWRSTFLIGTVNASKRFTPLRFRWSGKEGTDDWGCRAVAKDNADGEECIGALITIRLSKAEGWYQRNGSKWQTIPEQMLMYRAAAFWVRIYSPELALGIRTTEESEDQTLDAEYVIGPSQALPQVETRDWQAEADVLKQAVTDAAASGKTEDKKAVHALIGKFSADAPEEIGKGLQTLYNMLLGKKKEATKPDVSSPATPSAQAQSSLPISASSTSDPYLPPHLRGDSYSGPLDPPVPFK